MLIAVDAGKYETKAINEEKRISFRTKVDTKTNYSRLHGGKTYEVEYNGQIYVVGDDAITSDYDVSKESIVHKIAIYTACGLLGNSNNIDLIIGCPVIQFVDATRKDQYKNFIMENKNISIKINGEIKRFYLNSVLVLPESLGVVHQDVNHFIDRLIGVIDIGGLNTNGAIYDRLKLVKSSIFTINEGGLILQAKIKRALNSQLMQNYQDYEIPHVINSTDDKTKSIINEILYEHINTIKDEMKKYNWDIQNLDLYFIGGGSITLDKAIKSAFQKVFRSSDAVWINVNGFYKVGSMLCQTR